MQRKLYHHHKNPPPTNPTLPKGINKCSTFLWSPNSKLLGNYTTVNNVSDIINYSNQIYPPAVSPLIPSFPIRDLALGDQFWITSPISGNDLILPPSIIHMGPQDYTVSTGETLRSIAQKKYGNSELANELAHINGLPTAFHKIRAGEILYAPPLVNNYYKDTNVRPHYEFLNLVLGRLSPKVRQVFSVPKKPHHRKKDDEGGGFFGSLIKIIAIAVIVFTAPYLAGALGLLGTGTGIAGAIAAGTAVAEGAIGIFEAVIIGVTAAIEDAAFQGIAIGLKLQKDFSFSEMLEVGISAGTAPYAGSLNSIKDKSQLLETVAKRALRSASINITTQLAQMATGERNKFNINDVGVQVASTITDAFIELGVNKASYGIDNFATRSLKSTLNAATSGLLGSNMNSSSIDAKNIAANALGSIASNEINESIKESISVGNKLAQEAKASNDTKNSGQKLAQENAGKNLAQEGKNITSIPDTEELKLARAAASEPLQVPQFSFWSKPRNSINPSLYNTSPITPVEQTNLDTSFNFSNVTADLSEIDQIRHNTERSTWAAKNAQTKVWVDVGALESGKTKDWVGVGRDDLPKQSWVSTFAGEIFKDLVDGIKGIPGSILYDQFRTARELRQDPLGTMLRLSLDSYNTKEDVVQTLNGLKTGDAKAYADVTETILEIALLKKAGSIGSKSTLFGGKITGKGVAKLTAETKAFGPKTVEEMASELRNEIGQNSVNFSTVDKTGHIDLAGKGHYDKATKSEIPTPHVQTYDIHTGPNGKISISRKSEIVTPATKADIRIARRLAEQQGLLLKNQQILEQEIENTFRRHGL